VLEVSNLHNIVHPLFGVAGIAMAVASTPRCSCPEAHGAIYLLLWLCG
jgi:Domain of unknown function (DUF4383)